MVNPLFFSLHYTSTVYCHFYKFSIVSIVLFSRLHPSPAAEQTVDGAGDEKADEPGIVVPRDKRTGDTLQNSNLVQKSRHDRRDSGRHCNHRSDVETTLEVVRAAPVFGVERVDVQSGAPDNVVVGEDDTSDGAHERRVAEKPGVDEALTGAEQPPRLEGNAEQRGDERPLGEREPPRAHADQRVRRRDDVRGDVGRDGCEADAEDGKERRRRPSDAAEELDWVGYHVPEDGLGGRGDGEPGEGEHAHEHRQPRLADHLVRLAPRVPREVRYVDGHRRPEADVGCERREEDLPELCACQPRRQRQDAPEPTGRCVGPGQQRGGEHDEHRRRELLELADALHSVHDDAELRGPEREEARELERRRAEPGHRREQRRVGLEPGREEQEYGAAADPGLDAEPAAADERADDGRDVRAADAERGAREHRERQAVRGRGRGREDERDEDDEVGEGDGGDALERGHAEVHEAAREVVGRHADDEADPEAGEVPGRHGAFRRRGRGKVRLIRRRRPGARRQEPRAGGDRDRDR